MERSRKIFGNPMSRKVYHKAVKSKAKYIGKFGDDSKSSYPVILHKNDQIGDLVNTVAPIHVKQDSLTHNLIAKFVKMDGEQEDLHAYGDVLMEGGVRLKQAFCGTGYNDQVRYFQDFGSRMYFMEAEE